MKKNIHPQYNVITVECTCGNSFKVGSTLADDLRVEVCNECHPFYTGKQKVIDTAGRVDSFNRRFGIVKEN
jgi:large subunit ribosomal protein L31